MSHWRLGARRGEIATASVGDRATHGRLGARRRPRARSGTGPGSFWEHFERRYGKNPDLADVNVKAFAEPLIRDDFRLVETYSAKSDTLTCPLLAVKYVYTP